jgi:hypothetical protein
MNSLLIYKILFVCLLILYIHYKNTYIVVCGISGLGNKIRVLLSYMYKARKENKKLIFYWRYEDSTCPEYYNNLFENIPDVEIRTMNKYNIFCYIICNYIGYYEENKEYINHKYNLLLKPIPILYDKINIYKQHLHNNYIACHIRRTDSIGHVSFKHKTDEEYMKFIDSHDNKLKIYIATDNRDTQDLFIKKYGDRLYIKPIIPSDKYRQTSVQDAVIDIYVCAGANYFMGTDGSSFTDTINNIRM